MSDDIEDPYLELKLMFSGFGLLCRAVWYALCELEQEHYESWYKSPSMPESESPYRDRFPDWDI